MSIVEGVEWGNVGQLVGATATFLASVVALRTSNHSQKAFMLDKRPYLAFDKMEIEAGYFKETKTIYTNAIYFTLYLKNLGKTIANYNVENFVVTIDDIETNFFENEYKSEGRILPDSSDLINIPSIKGEFEKIVSGNISFTIIYYRDETDEKYEWNMNIKFFTELEAKELYPEVLEDKEKIVRTKKFWGK